LWMIELCAGEVTVELARTIMTGDHFGTTISHRPKGSCWA
jgi:hypothetical protein